MKALVYKSTGSWYVLKNDEGKIFNARIKGVFKIDGITSTNPIAVGDIVSIETESDDVATITDIETRRNYIIRQSPSHKMQKHIVAANIDQTILFASLKNPQTSQGFMDRFLVTAEAYHVPAVIVFNKTDLYKSKETEKLRLLTSMYEQIGYKVITMSLPKSEGVEDLKNCLMKKISLLSGHSGVGKSSFVNSIIPSLQLKTNEVSGWSGKGIHTTTFAEMFDLPFYGKIIDTPGIREFGLVDFTKQELSHYFPEMRNLINSCKFNNCLHVNEPDCAIIQAVETGDIHPNRYVSYINILSSIE